MENKFLTVQEAARMLRHHPETVRRWARSGKVEAAYVGYKILIPLESLLRLIRPIGLRKDPSARRGKKNEGCNP